MDIAPQGAEMLPMKISIFGLGYVGTVCGACFAERGHRVIGVDRASVKVDLICSGKSPVIEPGLDEKVRTAVSAGLLSATTNAVEAIAETDLSIICVGTPAGANGNLDLAAIEQVASEIGHALRGKQTRHTIVVRSTVLPGTTRHTIVPRIEAASGKKLGSDFDVVFNPEFLREGCAIADFNCPSKTVIGVFDAEAADRVIPLYSGMPGALITPPVETAELVKYVDNAWHALKVTFANEIGIISKTLGIDSRSVMDIFIKDTRLNISSAYLRPGFSFGGSCLEKDLRALTHMAHESGLAVPLIENVLPSNRATLGRGVEWILSYPGRRITFLGISFKAGTDDVRESPYVALVKELLLKEREIRIYDPNVQLAHLIGANKEFLLRAPNLVELLEDDPCTAIRWADIIVVTTPDPHFSEALKAARPNQIVLDLTGIEAGRTTAPIHGFLW